MIAFDGLQVNKNFNVVGVGPEYKQNIREKAPSVLFYGKKSYFRRENIKIVYINVVLIKLGSYAKGISILNPSLF